MTSPHLDHRVRSLEEVRIQRLLDQVTDQVARYSCYQHTQLPEKVVFLRLCDAEHALKQAVEAYGGGE